MKKNMLVLFLLVLLAQTNYANQKTSLANTNKWLFSYDKEFNIKWKNPFKNSFLHYQDSTVYIAAVHSKPANIIIGDAVTGKILAKLKFERQLFNVNYNNDTVLFKLQTKNKIKEIRWCYKTGKKILVSEKEYKEPELNLSDGASCPLPNPADTLDFVVTEKYLLIIDPEVNVKMKIQFKDNEYCSGTISKVAILCSENSIRAIDRMLLKEVWSCDVKKEIFYLVLGGTITVNFRDKTLSYINYLTGEIRDKR